MLLVGSKPGFLSGSGLGSMPRIGYLRIVAGME